MVELCLLFIIGATGDDRFTPTNVSLMAAAVPLICKSGGAVFCFVCFVFFPFRPPSIRRPKRKHRRTSLSLSADMQMRRRVCRRRRRRRNPIRRRPRVLGRRESLASQECCEAPQNEGGGGVSAFIDHRAGGSITRSQFTPPNHPSAFRKELRRPCSSTTWFSLSLSLFRFDFVVAVVVVVVGGGVRDRVIG